MGLLAAVFCVRCRGTGGPLSCITRELRFGFPPWIEQQGSFVTNAGRNDISETPDDPFGTNGPLPPGTYDLPNAVSPKFRRRLPSPTNIGAPGQLNTPIGTFRNGIRLHAGTHSQGCITTGPGLAGHSLEHQITQLVDRNQSTGGTTLSILEINCACAICP